MSDSKKDSGSGEGGESKAAPSATAGKARKAPAKKKPPPKGWTAYTEKNTVPAWVTAARTVMVLAFCATIPTILGVEAGRRLFWAACIAILPLFWVVGGFHLWRRICPLAVVSLIPRYAGFSGSRNFRKSWLADNYIYMQFGLMIFALSLRLTATNGSILGLVGFLIFVIVAAITINSLYTGKTWCNYICPVGVVEKFYTEPSRVALRGGWAQKNSQCSPCTACKLHCPDIDMEQGYWKEAGQPARRVAYFAWPGLVFAFYFYYYLVAGNWDYYFSGDWTRENDQVTRILAPGFHFLESIPIIVAAPLTLLVFCGISFAIFATGERLALSRALASLGEIEDEEKKRERDEVVGKRVRHRALMLAGFIGFIIFYFYGGQPTIRMLPGWFGEIFAVLVAIAATAILIRRWPRSEEDFVKERFAEKLLKRWKWGDQPPAGRPGDVVLVHEEREKHEAARLAAYKETIREMVADGIVTASEMSVLQGLRDELGVSEKDHKKVLGELNEEEQQLFDPEYQGSVELRLQQTQFHTALETAVLTAARAGRLLSSEELADLRREYGAEEEEEAVLMEELLSDDGPLAELVARDARELHELAAGHAAAQAGSRGGVSAGRYAFLAFICRWRATQRLEHALTLVVPLIDKALYEKLRDSGARLLEPMRVSHEAWAKMLEAIGDSPPPVVQSHVEAVEKFASRGHESVELGDNEEPDVPVEPFLALLGDTSAYVRAATLYAIARRSEDAVAEALRAAGADPSPLVREIAAAEPDSPSTIGTMRLLRRISLFERFDPDDLEKLTSMVRERAFEEGEVLIREGEIGRDVFIIDEGEVEVWTEDAKGDRVVLDTCGPGTCVGEVAAFDRSPRTASVTATRNTRTLVIEGEAIKSLLAERPAMSRTVIGLLLRRLREAFATARSTRVAGDRSA